MSAIAVMFGWTVTQFATAKAHHARVTGNELPATPIGAMELKKWWVGRRIDQPGEKSIIGANPERDYAWAWDTVKACGAKFSGS